jgi:hypothetical protein
MRQWICTSSFIRHFAIPIPQTRKYWERHVFACQRRLFALERRVFALSHYATHTLIWNTYYKSLSYGYDHFLSSPFSYPEPFLRAARRGALAKSITGYHENMVIEYIRY